MKKREGKIRNQPKEREKGRARKARKTHINI